MSGRASRTSTPDDRKPLTISPSGSALPFTFVNQHEDLKSVVERKIQSESQRHEIRSHVMRGVRQQEQAHGKKRPTGRSSRGKSTEGSSNVTTRSSSTSEQARSPFTSIQGETSAADTFAFAPSHSTVAVTGSASSNDQALHVHQSSHVVDTRRSLPGANLSAHTVELLLDYSFITLLPMMFPVEKKHPQELLARRSTYLDTRNKRPVAFSAFIAAAAAHRAIYYGHHKDLSPFNRDREDLLDDSDFKTAYSDAVRAIRIKVQADETADSEFLDACFSLMSTATMIGNFAEAQAHLRAVQHALPTVELSAIAQEWLPLTDNKAAIGMLTRPIVPLPWPRTHINADVLTRISPRPNAPMARLGTSFNSLDLSAPLRQIINDTCLICHLCQLNESTPGGLTHSEHEIYRRMSLAAEHDLLTYVYETFECKNEDPATLVMPAIEQVLRLAVLGLYSTISICVLPNSGLGRALTLHHKIALQRWCARTASTQPNMMELRAVVWALFIYMQCAADQIEVGEFETLMASLTKDSSLSDWGQVDAMLYEFLYVPGVQRPPWTTVWEGLQRKSLRKGGEEKGKMNEENEEVWM